MVRAANQRPLSAVAMIDFGQRPVGLIAGLAYHRREAAAAVPAPALGLVAAKAARFRACVRSYGISSDKLRWIEWSITIFILLLAR